VLTQDSVQAVAQRGPVFEGLQVDVAGSQPDSRGQDVAGQFDGGRIGIFRRPPGRLGGGRPGGFRGLAGREGLDRLGGVLPRQVEPVDGPLDVRSQGDHRLHGQAGLAAHEVLDRQIRRLGGGDEDPIFVDEKRQHREAPGELFRDLLQGLLLRVVGRQQEGGKTVVAGKRGQQPTCGHVVAPQEEIGWVPSLVGQGAGLVQELLRDLSDQAVEPFAHPRAPLRSWRPATLPGPGPGRW